MRANVSAWRKATAVVLASAVFSTSALSQAAESNIWADRRNQMAMAVGQPPASRIFLPPISRPLALPLASGSLESSASGPEALAASMDSAYGRVRRILRPAAGGSGLVVLHIQDIHRNAEAQRNISRTLQELLRTRDVGVVAVEGSEGAIAAGPLVSAKDALRRRKVLDYLLEHDDISGPVHAVVGVGSPVRMLGIDDRDHHRLNVDAYRRASGLAPEWRDRLAAARERRDRERDTRLNADLAAFDELIAEYETQKRPLTDVVRALSRIVHPLPSSLAAYLEAAALEGGIDEQRVEAERSQVVRLLADRLDEARLNGLVADSLAARLGHVRQGAFYERLADLCGRAGVNLAAYPHFAAYLRYIAVADALDGERFFDDLQSARGRAYDALIRNSAERAWVDEGCRLRLAAKLVDFALSRAEWNLYKSRRMPGLSAFERFYEEAEIRDGKMTANFLKSIDAPEKVAVLVTGGFHANGMDEALVRAGATVLTFVPTLTEVNGDGGSAYLSVFAREKTPLDRLLEGDRLFLADRADAGLPVKAPLLYDALNPAAADDAAPAGFRLRRIDTPSQPTRIEAVHEADGETLRASVVDSPDKIVSARFELVRSFAARAAAPFLAPKWMLARMWAYGLPFLRQRGYSDRAILRLGGLEALVFVVAAIVAVNGAAFYFDFALWQRQTLAAALIVVFYFAAHASEMTYLDGGAIAYRAPRFLDVMAVTFVGLLVAAPLAVLTHFFGWQAPALLAGVVAAAGPHFVHDVVAAPLLKLGFAVVPPASAPAEEKRFTVTVPMRTDKPRKMFHADRHWEINEATFSAFFKSPGNVPRLLLQRLGRPRRGAVMTLSLQELNKLSGRPTARLLNGNIRFQVVEKNGEPVWAIGYSIPVMRDLAEALNLDRFWFRASTEDGSNVMAEKKSLTEAFQRLVPDLRGDVVDHQQLEGRMAALVAWLDQKLGKPDGSRVLISEDFDGIPIMFHLQKRMASDRKANWAFRNSPAVFIALLTRMKEERPSLTWVSTVLTALLQRQEVYFPSPSGGRVLNSERIEPSIQAVVDTQGIAPGETAERWLVDGRTGAVVPVTLSRNPKPGIRFQSADFAMVAAALGWNLFDVMLEIHPVQASDILLSSRDFAPYVGGLPSDSMEKLMRLLGEPTANEPLKTVASNTPGSSAVMFYVREDDAGNLQWATRRHDHNRAALAALLREIVAQSAATPGSTDGAGGGTAAPIEKPANEAPPVVPSSVPPVTPEPEPAFYHVTEAPDGVPAGELIQIWTVSQFARDHLGGERTARKEALVEFLLNLPKDRRRYTIHPADSPAITIYRYATPEAPEKAIWKIREKDVPAFADYLGFPKKRGKGALKKSDLRKAKDMLAFYGFLELAESLKGSPGMLYQAISLLMAQVSDSNYSQEERERLLRLFVKSLNMSEGGGTGHLPGNGPKKINPFEYLEALFGLHRVMQNRGPLERKVLVRAFVRFSFHDLIKNYERTVARVNEVIRKHFTGVEEGMALFAAELQKELEDIREIVANGQPDHIKTPLKPHQKYAVWLIKKTMDLITEIMDDAAESPSEDDQKTARQLVEDLFGHVSRLFLLADDARLGKTLEILASIDPKWKTVIVVPRNVMDTWIRQFDTHVNADKLRLVPVVGSVDKKRQIIKENEDAKGVILLVSLQDIRGWLDKDKKLDDRCLSLQKGLDLLVIDEAQGIENYSGPGKATNSDQAEVAHSLAAPRILLGTASPFTSEPDQMWGIFRLAYLNRRTGTTPNKLFETRATFKRNLTRDAEALKLLYALWTLLGLRRTKDEFGDMYSAKKEIPPTYQAPELPGSQDGEGVYVFMPRQEQLILRILKDLAGYLDQLNLFLKMKGSNTQYTMESLTYLLKRYVLDLAAIDPAQFLGEKDVQTNFWTRMDDFVKPRVVRDDPQQRKGIIVARNQEVIEAIARHYRNSINPRTGRNYRVEVIYGKDDEGAETNGDTAQTNGKRPDRRTEAQMRFQNDDDIDLVILGENAGVGIQLDKAGWMLYAQMPINYVSYYQSSERGLGFNPYSDRQKEVEIGYMVGRYSQEFLDAMKQFAEEEKAREPAMKEALDGSEASRQGEAEQSFEAEMAGNGNGHRNGRKSRSNWDHVRNGSPAQVWYRVMMEVQRPEYHQVLDGIPPQGDITDRASMRRIVALLPGFLEHPGELAVARYERRQVQTVAYFYALYEQVLKETFDADDPLEDEKERKKYIADILFLVQAYARSNISADGLGQAIRQRREAGEKFDLRDIRLLKALFTFPNKYQRRQLILLLPYIYQKIWGSELKGLADLAMRGPPVLKELARNDPAMFVPFIAASQAWRGGKGSWGNHPGTQVLIHLLERIPLDRVSEREAWKLVTPLISLIELESDGLLNFLAHHHDELLEAPGIKSQTKFFTNLVTLMLASPRAYHDVLRGRGTLRDSVSAIRRKIQDHMTETFGLADIPDRQRKLARLEKNWGDFNAPLQMMATLRKGEGKEYREYMEMFREAVWHMVYGDFDQWVLRQGDLEDPNTHKSWPGSKTLYRQNDRALWDTFLRPENVAIGDVTITADAHDDLLRQKWSVLVDLLRDTDVLEGSFGVGVTREFVADRADIPAARQQIKARREELLAAKKKITRLIEEGNAPINYQQHGADLNAEYARLALRERVMDVFQLDKEFTEKGASVASLDIGRIKSVKRILIAVRAGMLDQQDPEKATMALQETLTGLIDLLTMAKGSGHFSNVTVQITKDPNLILRSGMLHPDLFDCGNLNGMPRQVATLVEDLVNRTPLVIVRAGVDQNEMAVTFLKMRQRDAGLGQEGAPVIHIERPNERAGYGFVEQIRQALEETKLKELPYVGISRDFDRSDGEANRVLLRVTGIVTPWEFSGSLFQWKKRAYSFTHSARLLTPAKETPPTLPPVGVITSVRDAFAPMGAAAYRFFVWIGAPLIEELSGHRPSSARGGWYALPFGYGLVPLAVAAGISALGTPLVAAVAAFIVVAAAYRSVFIFAHEPGRRTAPALVSVLAIAASAVLLAALGIHGMGLSLSLAASIASHIGVNVIGDRISEWRLRRAARDLAADVASLSQGRGVPSRSGRADLVNRLIPELAEGFSDLDRPATSARAAESRRRAAGFRETFDAALANDGVDPSPLVRERWIRQALIERRATPMTGAAPASDVASRSGRVISIDGSVSDPEAYLRLSLSTRSGEKILIVASDDDVRARTQAALARLRMPLPVVTAALDDGRGDGYLDLVSLESLFFDPSAPEARRFYESVDRVEIVASSGVSLGTSGLRTNLLRNAAVILINRAMGEATRMNLSEWNWMSLVAHELSA